MTRSDKKAAVEQDVLESSRVTPYVAPTMVLPEMTVRSVFLGLFLAMLFAASTCYLGLKVGRTIAASIPAAVISMSVLRWFKRSNILENNIVQTIASAGEVVAASAIFTLPAIILMGQASGFAYLETFLIISIGGTLGVLFSVPLRRCMIVDQALPYPEGVAAGEILKVGDSSSFHQARDLVVGSVFGAVVSFAQIGLKVVSESFAWFTMKAGSVFGVGIGFSPILIAAGRIVGFRGMLGVGVGAFVAWGVGIPLYAYLHGLPSEGDALSLAMGIAKDHFRFVGVGAMMVGGLWGVLSLLKPIHSAMVSSFRALLSKSHHQVMVRTERDLPMVYVLVGIVLVSIPLCLMMIHALDWLQLPLSKTMFWWLVIFSVVFSLIIGFLSASIAAYLTGAVGSSMLPTSGITLSAIMLFAFSILVLVGNTLELSINSPYAVKAASLTIVVAAIVCAASSVSGDNLQDLKTGQIVGATPWKQQVGLVFGVIGGSLVLAPVLDILFQAYGMGDVLPRADMDPTKTLAAPQATLMATVAQGVFAQKLEWSMIGLGIGIGIIAIFVDEAMKKTGSGYRMPVLSVALGMYLPMTYTLPLLLGGLIGFWSERKLARRKRSLGADYAAVSEKLSHRSTLIASGVIAGESLMGILLAIPFALYQRDDVLALNIEGFEGIANLLGFGSMAALIYIFYSLLKQVQKKA